MTRILTDRSSTNPSTPIFVHRVLLKNYKSIASCDVLLKHPLTVLVGPNGAGKSNFLDALRLVSDALKDGLEHALRVRGGINEVRRRSGGHPTHFSIRIEFALTNLHGFYSFRVGAQQSGGFLIQEEECYLETQELPSSTWTYRIENGEVTSNIGLPTPPPVVSKDRLYLVTMSGLPEFRPLFDALFGMQFYNLNPERIKALQPPDAGEFLERDGRNLASVLGRLERNAPELLARIEEYLEKVVPGVQGVRRDALRSMETLEFKQRVAGAKAPWRFPAVNMSDGTLRVLGILVALFQNAGDEVNASARPVTLVGIEEPETALNPGAAGVLLDGLRAASRRTQVLVTSHSPDLLDDDEISPDSILAVVSRDGNTEIGGLNAVGRQALKDHLYTVGELLRLRKLEPQVKASSKADNAPQLFDAADQ